MSKLLKKRKLDLYYHADEKLAEGTRKKVKYEREKTIVARKLRLAKN